MADKSVLEKYYDEEARKRRAPTPEQDAIKPDTTLEELLIGPGRFAANLIAKGVNKIVNKAAPIVTTPKIGSEVPDSSNRIRNLFDPDPPFPVLSPSQRAKKEALKNKQNLIDAIEDSMEVGTRRAAGELAADGYNYLNQETNKYAKGGKVSSASSRADGCCVKGKTKGRYL